MPEVAASFDGLQSRIVDEILLDGAKEGGDLEVSASIDAILALVHDPDVIVLCCSGAEAVNDPDEDHDVLEEMDDRELA